MRVGARATHDLAEGALVTRSRHRRRTAREGRRRRPRARARRRRRARRQRRRRRERHARTRSFEWSIRRAAMRFAHASSEAGKWRWSMFANAGVARTAAGRVRAVRAGSRDAGAQTPTAKPTRQLRRALPALSAGGARARSRRAPEIQAWSWMSALALDRRAQKRQRPGHDSGRREHHRQRHRRFGARRRTAAGVCRRAEALRHREEAAERRRSDVRSSRPRRNTDFKGAGTTTRAGELTRADDGARVGRAAQRRPGRRRASARSKSTAIGRSSC